MGTLKKSPKGASTGVVVAVIAGMVAVVALVVALGSLVFDPFEEETVDRSGPALLESMRELEEFTAAEGAFVQDVDLETDAPVLPDVLKGERVTALVTGTVRATVDFGDLDDDAVEVSADGTRITVTLPPPELQSAEIDESGTKIVSRQRGLIDRIQDVFSGNPFDDQQVYTAAEEKLDAAARESDLTETAKENTEAWLRTFLTAAGFEEVTVNWSKSPA